MKKRTIILIGAIVTGIITVSMIVQSASCEEWYYNLGNRLETLHAQFNGQEELVDDYKVLHQESDRLNSECSIVGFNIPKFS